MANVNAVSGVTSQQTIFENSLFMTRYMKPSRSGRRGILSGEYLDPTKDVLIGTTPVDQSMFILIPTYYPEIYTDVPGGDILKRCFIAYWNLIAQVTTSVSGFNDISINIQTPQFKTNFLNMPLFTVLENPTTEITFKLPTEYSGYFIVNQTRHWLNAISDEYTKIAVYNGLKETYNNWSHSGGMMYIKPSKTYDRCDYAAMFFLMVPKSAKTSAFDADATSPSLVTIDMTFTCSIIDNRNVRVADFANASLARYKEYIVNDSTLFGMEKGTVLETLAETAERDVFGQWIDLQ